MSEILVAVDGREASTRALEFAAERARAAGDDLHVVHVRSESDAAAEQMRETVEETLADAGVAYRFGLIDRGEDGKGVVGDRLLELIEDNDYAYVCLGNEPTDRVRRILVGSTAEQLLETRRIPVLLVP